VATLELEVPGDEAIDARVDGGQSLFDGRRDDDLETVTAHRSRHRDENGRGLLDDQHA